MKKFMNWFAGEESGQSMVEYALIIALIAVVLIGALVALSGGIESIFGDITDALQDPQNAGTGN